MDQYTSPYSFKQLGEMWLGLWIQEDKEGMKLITETRGAYVKVQPQSGEVPWPEPRYQTRPLVCRDHRRTS